MFGIKPSRVSDNRVVLRDGHVDFFVSFVIQDSKRCAYDFSVYLALISRVVVMFFVLFHCILLCFTVPLPRIWVPVPLPDSITCQCLGGSSSCTVSACLQHTGGHYMASGAQGIPQASYFVETLGIRLELPVLLSTGVVTKKIQKH